MIVGSDLPGRRFVSAGELLTNVHVALQVGKEPVGPVAGDASFATWHVDVQVVVGDDGAVDVRGGAIHGRRGERFLYLTWGNVDAGGSFRMFRRAKLMIADIGEELLGEAAAAERSGTDGAGLRVEITLTDGRGGPLCARVRPPMIRWSLLT